MESGIGVTLREARSRRKIELSEVEAAIMIRARYLRAMENEEWEALPGDAYTRGFIRTYASFLGLDGERLAAEHGTAPPTGREEGAPRAEPSPRASRGGRAGSRRIPRGVLTALVCAALIAVVVAVGLLTGNGGNGRETSAPSAPAKRAGSGSGDGPSRLKSAAGVELSLTTKAEVWVCVLDGKGTALVEGVVLPEGAEEGPFHSGSFTVAFGNGEVAMRIEGKDIDIPETASPLGYEIAADGALNSLPESERPSCL